MAERPIKKSELEKRAQAEGQTGDDKTVTRRAARVDEVKVETTKIEIGKSLLFP